MRRDRKRAARCAEQVDARAKRAQQVFRACVAPHPRAHDGHTPATVDGRPTFYGRGAGGMGRARDLSPDRPASYALTHASAEFPPPLVDERHG
jgi:hypothetical protein